MTLAMSRKYTKILTAMLLLFVLIVPSANAEQLKVMPSDLVGIWEAHGYYCRDRQPVEIIEITVDEGYLTATKIKGDDCVPSGHKTWEGQMSEREISANFYLSSGPNTAIYKSPSKFTLIVIDADTIKSEGDLGVSFKRQIAPMPDDDGLFGIQEPSG